uniref:Ribosomal protein L30 N-terminal domain-containing protein n=1 Tax=Romanomermis culicivorax TaxID=13658 RepID=A0A915JIF7_ROMCU
MTEVDSKAKTATPKKRRLPAIPETLLVRRKQTAEQKTKALKASVLARKARLVRKREIFRRAEKYIREHRRKEHQLKRLTLEAKKNGNFYVPAEPRLAFVIRIVG